MEGSESMIQDKAFMALVLIRTSGSLSTRINCSITYILVVAVHSTQHIHIREDFVHMVSWRKSEVLPVVSRRQSCD